MNLEVIPIRERRDFKVVGTSNKMINNIEKIMNKNLNNYFRTLDGNAPENEELDLSKGWEDICKFAYKKCPGPKDKKIFNKYCVSYLKEHNLKCINQ